MEGLLNDLMPLLCTGLVLITLAGQFDNHLWRLLLIFIGGQKFGDGITSLIASTFFACCDDHDHHDHHHHDHHHEHHDHSSLSPIISTIVWIIIYIGIWWIPQFQKFQKRNGCVFITGADSGMGQATVLHLAKTNCLDKNKSTKNQYDIIFAGCYNAKQSLETFTKLLENESNKDEILSYIQVIPLDVTNDDSITTAAKQVQTMIKEKDNCIGLLGLVNFHGVAYNGPIQYMPISMYTKQIDVNYIGNIRMIQQFLPLLRDASTTACNNSSDSIKRPGRIICTGTGGGSCSPCPPLLSAYMSSKFAGEAFCHSLRMELFMTNVPIECCVINPGFVKPTMLMAEGLKLTNAMWKACEERFGGSTIAKDEFGPLMSHFLKYSELQPGTHVSEVAYSVEHALLSSYPRSSYKVGIDSKLAPIVGLFPTGVRETIARNGIYGILSPAGTVPGYKV